MSPYHLNTNKKDIISTNTTRPTRNASAGQNLPRQPNSDPTSKIKEHPHTVSSAALRDGERLSMLDVGCVSGAGVDRAEVQFGEKDERWLERVCGVTGTA